MQRISQRTGSRRTQSSSWSHGRWGGFLLLRRDSQILHVKLMGRFSIRTLDELDRRVRAAGSGRETTFVVLDASHLSHIPLACAQELSLRDQCWRRLGIVALWVGLSRYLANLLVLACGSDGQLPAYSDLRVAQAAIWRIAEAPPTVARGRLEMSGSLVH